MESNRKLIEIFEAKSKAKLDEIWGEEHTNRYTVGVATAANETTPVMIARSSEAVTTTVDLELLPRQDVEQKGEE